MEGGSAQDCMVPSAVAKEVELLRAENAKLVEMVSAQHSRTSGEQHGSTKLRMYHTSQTVRSCADVHHPLLFRCMPRVCHKAASC